MGSVARSVMRVTFSVGVDAQAGGDGGAGAGDEVGGVGGGQEVGGGGGHSLGLSCLGCRLCGWIALLSGPVF